MLKINLKSKKGFTLIETLVALAIFASSVAVLVSMTASGVTNTNFAKNKITASYLAQEGIEMVRNIRDTAVITNPTNGWSSFSNTIVNSACGTASCDIEPTSLVVSTDPSPTIKTDFPGFIRSITVESKSPNEVKVTSKVTWKQGGQPKEVSMTENLFNWTAAAPTGGPGSGPGF